MPGRWTSLLSIAFAVLGMSTAANASSGREASRLGLHSTPSPRDCMQLAQDPTGHLVMFGGFDGTSQVLSDTWTWDGTGWSEQFPSDSPPARYCYAMAYDAVRQQTVLFGGTGQNKDLNDTWTWDGTDWTEQFPANPPPTQYGPAMAFDAARGVIVMLGYDQGVATWTWDGTDWTRQHPVHSPTDRPFASMAYDATTQLVVLFGGENERSCGDWGCYSYSDTVTWDGTDWTLERPPHRPTQREGAAIAFDAARGYVLMFGGGQPVVGGHALDDTKSWEGRRWKKHLPADHPPARGWGAMAFDPTSGAVVLFGGYGIIYLGDTWTWDGVTWTEH